MIQYPAKQIIFPFPGKKESTFYQFTKNVFMPFILLTGGLLEDGHGSLETETILVCGDACYNPNHPDRIFFKIHLDKKESKTYVVGLNTPLYELQGDYELRGRSGYTFKLCDDMYVKPFIDNFGNAVMARDVVWDE